MTQPKTPFLISLLVYTAILRMLPYLLMNCEIHTDMSVLYYPWNFNPLAAACLFGGAYLADRRLALLVPLATLFVSDLGIWALSGRADWAFSRITYVSFIGATLMGFLLRNAVRSQGSRLRRQDWLHATSQQSHSSRSRSSGQQPSPRCCSVHWACELPPKNLRLSRELSSLSGSSRTSLLWDEFLLGPRGPACN